MFTPLLQVFKRSFIDPLAEFIHDSRAIGIVLILCTVFSLAAANIFTGYTGFWDTEIPFAHALKLPHSILHFINDALMTVFFFLAGMEIRRELTSGQLSSFKQSVLPVAGAFGGMAVPAIIFLLINAGSSYVKGWAVPTATDIAFSLGIASLLGDRVPLSVKVFLTALAIIDDLGAIIVIAFFYGGQLQLLYVSAVIIIGVLLWFFGRRVKTINVWFILAGVALWYCMFNSGIHATIAGVLFAFLVPQEQLTVLENKLHHSVYFLIVPLFALANTAIIFPQHSFQALQTTLSWGIILGLFLGKPLGITASVYLLIKMNWAALPERSTFKHLIGAGILAGIGFTMSIFIATLAFDTENQNISKLAVLIASLASGISGYFWLNATAKKR